MVRLQKVQALDGLEMGFRIRGGTMQVYREVRVNLPQNVVEFIENKIGANVTDFCQGMLEKLCEKLENDLKVNELKKTSEVEDPQEAS